MRLAIQWPHDPGEIQVTLLRGGPITLAIRRPHEAGEFRKTWPHQLGEWHFKASSGRHVDS